MKCKTKFITKASTALLTLGPILATQIPDQGFAADRSLQIEEVVVTARKTAEKLQDVPLAISAFTARDIENAGIANVKDIAALTPGFTFAPIFGSPGATPVIRGLSTTIGEPNVGFFIDGVYQSSRASMDALLGDSIARVEVAKGPQSALYGRNTFGGAINFITKRPTNDMEASVEGTAGNHGKVGLRGSVSGPIIEGKLFFRVAGSYDDFDGFYTNELTNTHLDTSRTRVGAISLEATPTDALRMVLRVGYEDTDKGDFPLRFAENNSDFFPPLNDFQLYTGSLPSLTSGYAVTPGFFDRNNLTTSLRMDWTKGAVTLTSITGYNNLEIDSAVDNDYEARSIRFNDTSTDQDEFSQELRAAYDNGGKLRAMLGVFYYHLKVDNKSFDRFVGLAAGFGGNINNTIEKTDNYAVFGQVNYALTGQLSLNLSGRYSYEKKKAFATDTNPLTMAMGTFDDEKGFHSFTPRISLDYKVTPDAMLYASAARAEKAGGFNVVTVSGAILDSERVYNPEKSWNYEIGAKTSWLDNRLRFNIDAFWVDWKDQIVRALGQTFAVLNANAGRTTSKGIEAELQARPVEGLDISAGFAYTDAKYDDYTFGALAGLGVNPVLDGNTLQYVSKYTANGSIQYTTPVTDGLEWFGRGDIVYQSKQTAIQTASAYTRGSTKVNLRSGFQNDRYKITFWVDNVFNNKAPQSGVFLPNNAVTYDSIVGNRPGRQIFEGLINGPVLRTYGVTVKANF